MKVKKYIFIASFFIIIQNKSMEQLCYYNDCCKSSAYLYGVSHSLAFLTAEQFAESITWYVKDYIKILKSYRSDHIIVGDHDIHARCYTMLRNHIDREHQRRFIKGFFFLGGWLITCYLTHQLNHFCGD